MTLLTYNYIIELRGFVLDIESCMTMESSGVILVRLLTCRQSIVFYFVVGETHREKLLPAQVSPRWLQGVCPSVRLPRSQDHLQRQLT